MTMSVAKPGTEWLLGSLPNYGYYIAPLEKPEMDSARGRSAIAKAPRDRLIRCGGNSL